MEWTTGTKSANFAIELFWGRNRHIWTYQHEMWHIGGVPSYVPNFMLIRQTSRPYGAKKTQNHHLSNFNTAGNDYYSKQITMNWKFANYIIHCWRAINRWHQKAGLGAITMVSLNRSLIGNPQWHWWDGQMTEASICVCVCNSSCYYLLQWTINTAPQVK